MGEIAWWDDGLAGHCMVVFGAAWVFCVQLRFIENITRICLQYSEAILSSFIHVYSTQ